MFKWVSIAAAILFAYLAVVLLISPATQMEFLGVAVDAGGQIMARRSAPAFGAVAVLFLVFRNSTDVAAMRPMAWTGLGMMLAIAVIGLYEVMTGRVGSEIYGAIIVELIFAALFAAFLLRHPKA